MEGVEGEVREFLDAERPVLPVEPTRCPVEACGPHKYNRHSSFYRHLEMKDQEKIDLFECSLCHQVVGRK